MDEPKWIKVGSELPPTSCLVWGWGPMLLGVELLSYDSYNHTFWRRNGELILYERVTHWQLCEAPSPPSPEIKKPMLSIDVPLR